jgi:ATP-dependent Clp protease adapter protein ClpS
LVLALGQVVLALGQAVVLALGQAVVLALGQAQALLGCRQVTQRGQQAEHPRAEVGPVESELT